MKLSTKVQIANEVSKQLGGRPVMTMNQLHAALVPLKARSKAEMRVLIRKMVFDE